MKGVPTLCPFSTKYLGPDGIEALRTMALFASDPTTFNDPFEVRPGFDQERHDYFAKCHESFYAQMGIEHSLLGSGSMVGIPTENAVGFGETINERFRKDLSRRYRVLCLSRDPGSVLLWGHYYYQTRGVERLLAGNVTNNPNEKVQSDAGLIIPFSEYRRLVDAAFLDILTTKDVDWAYEREVRFIYELPSHASQLRYDNGRYLVAIPPSALREVILGFRAAASLAEEVVHLFRAGRLGNSQLFYSWCHPYRYEVQKHEARPEHLLDYYKVVRPTL